MARSSRSLAFVSSFVILLCISGAIAGSRLECEDLPPQDCAFAVSTMGNRCVLEKFIAQDTSAIYECQTSNVMAEKQEAWIESDECVKECGVERMWVGFSSDGLANRNFVNRLCSPVCQNNCPNIVNLFESLAAGEGVNLAEVCNYVRPSAHRILADSLLFKNTQFVLQSLAGAAAPQAAISAESITLAPAPAPSTN
ncbi:hypothetical protein SELMODRAFT_412334 [Selaginella moellendorffii]|uniref:PAR1 protein n=1 Tax=Selaginella moellendorffii TaxID=88036 RepID=D8RKT8_SELML|nr:uncharacterized protein LOC9640003 [Selaginella moellendorffii]EFJ27502.1 hypothetical protein SELMODRAFT_412334 [Selaginella moellendorffii]|eukprot:XP_002971753.1 uncharacterized protein LOC9640003 [Selaginella moellendorffii]